jgi:hypothetical protein
VFVLLRCGYGDRVVPIPFEFRQNISKRLNSCMLSAKFVPTLSQLNTTTWMILRRVGRAAPCKALHIFNGFSGVLALDDDRLVPGDGTRVQFTALWQGSVLQMSSSGGGLFGRPAIRKDRGRFLIFGRKIPRPAGLRYDPVPQSRVLRDAHGDENQARIR